MPAHLVFCGCRRCRSGRHTASESRMILLFVRKVRRRARQALRAGREPEPRVSVPYTD